MNNRLMSVAVLSVALALSPQVAQAEMVNTTNMLTAESRQAHFVQIENYLARDEVRSQLEQMGVDATQASDRVAALTDSQLQQLAVNIETMPAGSDALGVLVTVLVVILLLEILGITNVSAKI